MTEKITTWAERRIDGTTWFRAECACGRYRSGLHATPYRAWVAGQEHTRQAHPSTSLTTKVDPFDLCE